MFEGYVYLSVLSIGPEAKVRGSGNSRGERGGGMIVTTSTGFNFDSCLITNLATKQQ